MNRLRRIGFARARFAPTLAIVLALGGTAGVASAHPLHTTMTEVTADERRGVIRVMIRVFAEDFAEAVTRSRAVQPSGPPERAALDYVRRAVLLSDGSRVLPLRFCGTRRAGDVRWICMETASPVRATDLRLQITLLAEKFEDQVNIVRSMVSGSPRSLLFTRGDGAKPLR